MDTAQALVDDLVREFPAFSDVHAEHLADMGGEVLPHVFFWDVVQLTVQAFLRDGAGALDWRGVLAFLEERSRTGDTGVQEVINTSFLDNLPYPGEPGGDIVDRLGPRLRDRLSLSRPL